MIVNILTAGGSQLRASASKLRLELSLKNGHDDFIHDGVYIPDMQDFGV